MNLNKRKYGPETRRGISQKQYKITKLHTKSYIRNKEIHMPETRRGAETHSKALKSRTTKAETRPGEEKPETRRATEARNNKN